MESAEKAGYRAARLAKGLSIGRKQLERWTKTRFGQSPQQWLDEQQLGKAIELLKRRETIKEVANKLGFKQFSHFSRKFKSYHGIPPRRFVMSLKANPTRPQEKRRPMTG